jgi:hypothetical protein
MNWEAMTPNDICGPELADVDKKAWCDKLSTEHTRNTSQMASIVRREWTGED